MNYLQHAMQQLCDLVRQNMASKQKDSDDIQWDVRVEILFLHALFGLKPVGVNRFFTMREIHQRFANMLQKELYSKVLWDHLDSMYDMAALHESEILPFPNEEAPFELSEDFDDLVKEKFGVSLTHSTDENDSSKTGTSLKGEAKKLNTPKLKQMMPPVTNSKSTFLTPGAVKTTKSSTGSKSDSRPPSVETTPKVKIESQPAVKSSKIKRASSPFIAKNTKPEISNVVKEESSEISAAKKSSKVENNSSAKKNSKSEPTVGTTSSKKSTKQELSTSSVKVKTETSDSSSKKVKSEKELPSKKGRVSSTAESSTSKKSSKTDVKKTETDTHKKSIDSSTSQKTKADRNSNVSSKSSKPDGLDSPIPSGSKKQSLGKVNTNDKKRRQSKVDDSSKKTPPSKRRRI